MSNGTSWKKTNNPLIKGFIQKEEGKSALKKYISEPSKKNLAKLNELFKEHYLKIKLISYFSKILRFEAKHYDKRRRNLYETFSPVLDAPISGEENMTMKDTLVDTTQDTTEIPSDSWEDTIENERLERLLKTLTKKQKQAIKYSYLMNMKDVEVSESLGVSQQSVSKTKRTAIKKLRRGMNVE